VNFLNNKHARAVTAVLILQESSFTPSLCAPRTLRQLRRWPRLADVQE
jgi:hypothetical protein